MAAHLRMLSTLPVRTHVQPVVKDRDRRGQKPKTPDRIKDQVKRLRGQGWTYVQIKRELKISTGTISKILSGLHPSEVRMKEQGKPKKVFYKGLMYPSVSTAARLLGVTRYAMERKLGLRK